MDISSDAMDLLYSRSWPGNVRELENAIERAVILSHGNVLSPLDFEFAGNIGTRKTSANAEIERLLSRPYKEAKRLAQEHFNKKYMANALDDHNGNVSRAAKAAGIERQSFQKIMRTCGVKSEAFRNKKK